MKRLRFSLFIPKTGPFMMNLHFLQTTALCFLSLFLLFHAEHAECKGFTQNTENKHDTENTKINKNTENSEVKSKAATEKKDASEDSAPTFLEILWFSEKEPREALLIAPKNKTPMILVRILTEDEKLTAIIGEQAALSVDGDAVVLECSAPKVLFGTYDVSSYSSEIFVFESGDKAAVNSGGKTVPCFLNPVTDENGPEIMKKYTLPEK